MKTLTVAGRQAAGARVMEQGSVALGPTETPRLSFPLSYLRQAACFVPLEFLISS